MKVLYSMSKKKHYHNKKTSSKKGIIAAQSIDEMRQLYGMANKFIINRKFWNYNGEIQIRRSIKGKSLSGFSQIQAMEKGFKFLNEKIMLSQDPDPSINELVECCKYLATYDRALQRINCSRRLRKKRLHRLRDSYYLRMKRKFPGYSKQGKGIHLFCESIKEQFEI
jgi:hypothetical protein